MQYTTAETNETTGLTAWISGGLKIEETQYVLRSYHTHHKKTLVARIALASDIRKAAAGVTSEERTKLINAQRRLQQRIDDFNTKAETYIPVQHRDDPIGLNSAGHSADNPELQGDGAVEHPPHEQVLSLPSSIQSVLEKPALASLVTMELDLRRGQANDALAQLRLAIAHKAFTWRNKRQMDSHRTGNRSFDEVARHSATIDQAAKVYRSCRRAMQRLGASLETLQRYQELVDEDLYTSTAAMTPNARGLRYESLSWIWRMYETPDHDATWLNECMLSTILTNNADIFQFTVSHIFVRRLE